MSDVLQQLSQLLGGSVIDQMSQRTGLDPSTVSKVTAAAVPLLLGALAKNASNEQGAASLASALSRDHDGTVLDNVPGFLGSDTAASQGAGILGHVLGARQEVVASSLGQATGSDAGSVMQILHMLAPIVLGAVGRNARQESALHPSSLAAMLGDQQEAVERQMPQSAAGLLGLLDANRDGSALDDLGNLATKFFTSGR